MFHLKNQRVSGRKNLDVMQSNISRRNYSKSRVLGLLQNYHSVMLPLKFPGRSASPGSSNKRQSRSMRDGKEIQKIMLGGEQPF